MRITFPPPALRSREEDAYMEMNRTIVKFEGNRVTRIIRKEAIATGRAQALPTLLFPREASATEVVFILFEDWSSSLLSKAIQMTVGGATVLSVLALAVESCPQYRFPHYGDRDGDSAPVFRTIDLVCSVTFMIDLGCRILSVPFVPTKRLANCGYAWVEEEDSRLVRLTKWLCYPRVIVDIISTLPVLITNGQGSSSLDFLAITRMLRMFRVLRLLKNSQGVMILHEAIRKSTGALISLAVFFVGFIFISASLAFYCEQGRWNPEKGYYEREYFGEMEETPYQSILHTLYWTMVTITTVGYGDMVPSSLLGRLTTGLTVFFSVIFLAIPIAVVSVNLGKATMDFHRKEKEKATAMTGKLKTSHLVRHNPSVEFYDVIVRETGNMEDCLVKVVQTVDFHSNFIKSTDSLLRKQIKCANLILVPSCLFESKRRILRMMDLMDDLYNRFVTLQNYHAKTWEKYLQTSRQRKDFTRALRGAIGVRVCFIFWYQYVASRKAKGGQLNATHKRFDVKSSYRRVSFNGGRTQSLMTAQNAELSSQMAKIKLKTKKSSELNLEGTRSPNELKGSKRLSKAKKSIVVGEF